MELCEILRDLHVLVLFSFLLNVANFLGNRLKGVFVVLICGLEFCKDESIFFLPSESYDMYLVASSAVPGTPYCPSELSFRCAACSLVFWIPMRGCGRW